MTGMRAGAGDGLSHTTGNAHMIVLDQHGVIQPEAVIGAAACTHRIFLQCAHAGNGFTGTADARLVPLNCGNHAGRGRGNAGQMPEKIQRRAFRRQRRAGRALYDGNHITGGKRIAVAAEFFHPKPGIDQLEYRFGNFDAGQPSGLTRAKGDAHSGGFRNDAVRRDIACAAQIFGQRGMHKRHVQQRREGNQIMSAHARARAFCFSALILDG